MKREIIFILLISLIYSALHCNARVISTASELINLFNNTKLVNEDIDLAADLDFENITIPASLGKKNKTMYTGKFNGNGHAIKNLVMNSKYSASLFFHCGNVTITNLVIDHSCSFTGITAAGLCTEVYGYAAFKNVINKANVTGQYLYSAGFVGNLSDIEQSPVIFDNCINEGTAQGQVYVSGFIGVVDSTYDKVIEFINCTNNGMITGFESSSNSLGGFIGALQGSGYVSLKFTNTINNGSIAGGDFISGFVGRLYTCSQCSIMANNSTNNGNARGQNYVSGFIGIVESNDETDFFLINSSNNGNVSGSDGVAGFFGVISVDQYGQVMTPLRFSLTGCINNGRIDGEKYIGGYFGEVFNSGTLFNITHSINSGAVNGSDNIGGFFGMINCQTDMVMNITNSRNDGTITSFKNAGSFIGALEYVTQVTLSGCSNTGTVKVYCSVCQVGGVIGSVMKSQEMTLASSLVISSFTSDSLIDVSCSSCGVGGLIGSISGTDQTLVSITDSIINGTLNVATNNEHFSFAGGILGYTLDDNENLAIAISNCTRNTQITVDNVDNVGGFIGASSSTKTIINCTTISICDSQSLGSITASKTLNLGGFIGYLFNIQSVTIAHSHNRGPLTPKESPDIVVGGLIGYYTSAMNIIIVPAILVSDSNNYGDIISDNEASVLGGLVGNVNRTINIDIVLERSANFGAVRALNPAGSVGGLVGCMEDNIAFDVFIRECTNHGLVYSGGSKSSDPNGVGGLIGSIVDNGNLTIDLYSFENYGPIVSSSGNNMAGGLIGRFVGNGMSTLLVKKVLNNNTVNASGEKNDLGGLIGRMCENPLVSVKFVDIINNGYIHTGAGTEFSNLGGIVGNMTQSPSMNVVVINVTNNGNVESCPSCKSNAGGLIGRVAPIYERSLFTLSVSNSINHGNVTSGDTSSMACGLFCTPDNWENMKGNVILTNVINKGSIGNAKTYGISTKASSASNVVSMGPTIGYDAKPFFGVMVESLSLFAHKNVCPNCTIATKFEEDGNGFFITTKDKKRVDEQLNRKAMVEQFGMVWSNKLELERGIHVTVGNPVNCVIDLVQNTGMGVFQALVAKHIEPGRFHFVDRKNMSCELDNHTIFKSDTDVALCRKVVLHNEYENVAYVEYNMPLGSSVPSKFFDGLYVVRNTHNKTVLYNTNSIIDSDTEITIEAICIGMNRTVCPTTKTCMWVIKCADKSVIIPVLVVCSIAVFACLAAGVFVLVYRMIKKHQELNGYSLMEEDLFNTKGGLTTVTVPIHGENKELQLTDEVGHGSFATVWKVLAVDDQTVFAVKIISNKSKNEFTSAQKEADLLCQLDTQFVVAVYGCSCTEKSMAIAMEYFPLGSLQKVLQDGSLESQARIPMLLDVARGMEYLHSMAIIHRDLKPGNVLVSSLDPREHPMCKFVLFTSFL